MVALVHSSISFATASLSLRSYNKYNALNKKRPRCKDNLGMDDNNLNKFQPLKGLKILELSRVLAGPWAAQLLADLGGDVVKIEAPKGDETRSWGPPFNSSNNSCYFESTNRGKKSVIADFSNQEDLEMVKTLASRADVIIENFKVGGLKKFGLDYSTIKNSNPKKLEKFYKLNFGDIRLPSEELIKKIAKKRGCLKTGGIIDLPRVEGLLLRDFRAGKLGRLSFDIP